MSCAFRYKYNLVYVIAIASALAAHVVREVGQIGGRIEVWEGDLFARD